MSTVVVSKDNAPTTTYRTVRRSYRNKYRAQKKLVKKAKKKYNKYATKSFLMQRKLRLSKYVLSLIDPFNPLVYGTKIPDSATTPSVGFPDQNLNTFTTDASSSNYNCIAYRPSIDYANVANAAVGSWTWPAAFGNISQSNARSNIQGNFSAIRPVAHGIKIMAQESAFSAKGFLHIALFPAKQNGSTWQLPTNISQMQRLPTYKKVTISSLTQGPMVVCNKYLDETAYRYFDPADNIGTAATNAFDYSYQWNTILVAYEGANTATSIVEIESIVHFEGIPTQNSSYAIPVSPAEPYNVNDLQHGSRVNSYLDNVFTNADNPQVQQQRRVDATQASTISSIDTPMGSCSVNAVGDALSQGFNSYMSGSSVTQSLQNSASSLISSADDCIRTYGNSPIYNAISNLVKRQVTPYNLRRNARRRIEMSPFYNH